MTFTVNATPVSCERCGYNAQFNWEGRNVCGSGCYELLMLKENKREKEWLQYSIAKLIGNSNQDIQDAIGNVIIDAPSVKIPSATYSRYYPSPHSDGEMWVIQLNKYHRDNLLWLLNAVGYPHGKSVEPFHLANTGDWNGEIPQMLAKPGGDCVLDKDDRPNKSVEDLKSDVDFWIKSNK